MYALQLRLSILESSNAHVSEPSTSHNVIHADKGKSFPSSLNTTLYWPGVKTEIHWERQNVPTSRQWLETLISVLVMLLFVYLNPLSGVCGVLK